MLADNCKILIIGYGKIGKIHSKYLSKHGFNWVWHDPYLNFQDDNKFSGDISCLDIDNFTHVIVSTPEGTHFDTYKNIRSGFSGGILVEKPVVINKNNMSIFEDELVYGGMVERFNPAIVTLLKNIQREKVINIDFTRCSFAPLVSKSNIFEDIGIHDLDLYTHIFGSNENLKLNLDVLSKTFCLTMHDENIISRFIWSKETYFKERTVVVRQTDCTFKVDLQDQTVKKYFSGVSSGTMVQDLYVEKSSPIENQLFNFINSNIPINAIESHNLMFKILDSS